MSQEGAYYRLAMKIIVDFGGTIAVPAVLAALAGQWLDARYGTGRRYIILLLALALLSTAVSIYKKAVRYKAEFESIERNV